MIRISLDTRILSFLVMEVCCETYNLTNLIKDPTCLKSPLTPSSIDMILTNKFQCFQNSHTIETDHHSMIITVMRSDFPKQAPTLTIYRNSCL